MSVTAPVRASITLTSDLSNVTAADTVTVGGTTYTFRAAVGTTTGEVLFTSYTTALANLTSAINATAGSGTTYGSNTTINDLCVATNPTASTVVLTAKVPGTVGNFISVAEGSTHLSLTAAGTLLTGGTGSVNATVEDLLLTSQCNSDVIKVLTQMKSS